jgi:hypothetical protein
MSCLGNRQSGRHDNGLGRANHRLLRPVNLCGRRFTTCGKGSTERGPRSRRLRSDSPRPGGAGWTSPHRERGRPRSAPGSRPGAVAQRTLSRRARSSARCRSAADRSSSARQASRTKGRRVRVAAARKAAKTRARKARGQGKRARFRRAAFAPPSRARSACAWEGGHRALGPRGALRFSEVAAGCRTLPGCIHRSVHVHSLPVWWCGASTGFDSGDPRWRSQIDRTTIAPIDRNSLCQFWNDSNQNLDVPR